MGVGKVRAKLGCELIVGDNVMGGLEAPEQSLIVESRLVSEGDHIASSLRWCESE